MGLLVSLSAIQTNRARAANVDEPSSRAKEANVTVFRDSGKTLVTIVGEITKNTAKAFASALEKNDDISMLSLHSAGGDVGAALEIADAVHARKIHTAIVPQAKCYSACVYIFLAGSPRYAFGELGVHRISFMGRGKGDIEQAQEYLAEIIASLSSYGVSPKVLELMFRTPHKQIRVLSLDELVEANIITSIDAQMALFARDSVGYILPKPKPSNVAAVPLPPGDANANGPERVVDLPADPLENRRPRRKPVRTAKIEKPSTPAKLEAAPKKAAEQAYDGDWTLKRGYRVAIRVRSEEKHLRGRLIFWPGREEDEARVTAIDIHFNDAFAPKRVKGVGGVRFRAGIYDKGGDLIGPVVPVKPGTFRFIIADGNLARQQNCEMIRKATLIEVPVYFKSGETDKFAIGKREKVAQVLSLLCQNQS